MYMHAQDALHQCTFTYYVRWLNKT